MSSYRIKPLVVGMNRTDQGVMTYMNGYGQKIHLPIYAFALVDGPRKILIDSGLEQVMPNPLAEQETGLSAMEFNKALASIGWRPEDVEAIVHTHLHNDHCENDVLCPNAVVYAQRLELEFLAHPHPLDHRMFPDILDGVKEIVSIEGDADLFEGVRVLFTPGHTPGTQSVAVNTPSGEVLIVGYCSNEKNFPQSRPAVIPGVHLDAAQSYDSMQRVVNSGIKTILPLHAVEVGLMGTIG